MDEDVVEEWEDAFRRKRERERKWEEIKSWDNMKNKEKEIDDMTNGLRLSYIFVYSVDSHRFVRGKK